MEYLYLKTVNEWGIHGKSNARPASCVWGPFLEIERLRCEGMFRMGGPADSVLTKAEREGGKGRAPRRGILVIQEGLEESTGPWSATNLPQHCKGGKNRALNNGVYRGT